MKKHAFIWVRGIYGKSPQHMMDALAEPIDEAFESTADSADERSVHHFPLLYPHTTALQANDRDRIRKMSRKLGDMIFSLNQTYDHVSVIVHSNGGLIVYYLPWEYDGPPVNAYLLHPAVDSEDLWSASRFKNVVVFHDYEDKALSFGAKIPFHRFGQLGKFGYEGPREPAPNIYSIPVKHKVDSKWTKHNTWMLGDNAEEAAGIIASCELNGVVDQ